MKQGVCELNDEEQNLIETGIDLAFRTGKQRDSNLISRRLRRDWVGLMVGIVPFVVTLYFFFQNVNRLLPPNL